MLKILLVLYLKFRFLADILYFYSVVLGGTQSKVKIIVLSSVAGAASKCACMQRTNGLNFAWSTGSKLPPLDLILSSQGTRGFHPRSKGTEHFGDTCVPYSNS